MKDTSSSRGKRHWTTRSWRSIGIRSARPLRVMKSRSSPAYGRHEVLEGDETEGIVIAEFPTFEAAKTGTTVRHIARCASTAKKALSIVAF